MEFSPTEFLSLNNSFLFKRIYKLYTVLRISNDNLFEIYQSGALLKHKTWSVCRSIFYFYDKKHVQSVLDSNCSMRGKSKRTQVQYWLVQVPYLFSGECQNESGNHSNIFGDLMTITRVWISELVYANWTFEWSFLIFSSRIKSLNNNNRWGPCYPHRLDNVYLNQKNRKHLIPYILSDHGIE